MSSINNIFISEHHYLIYIIGAIIFHWSYFMFDIILNKTSKKYKALTHDKKMYAVSNILKSLMLGGITPIAWCILYNGIANDTWNNNLIKNMGVLYTIPDTVSLMTVNKMDMTTKIHHSVVVIFNIGSMHNNYNEENVFRCMLVYACFSSFAFLVNFLLGIRFLHNNKEVDKYLSRAAFLIYSKCCLINWVYHYYELKNQWYSCDDNCFKIILYLAMVTTIAIDDIKLNKWLFNKSKLLTY